jgi:hypothetical protein
MNRISIASALALLSAATTGCESRGSNPEAGPSASSSASSSASPSASPSANSVAADAACVPQVVVLPRLDDGSTSWLAAMNDRGWAVGHSEDPEGYFRTAVMWRDRAVINLGLGGRRLAPSNGYVSSHAVDVNEDGVVAAQRFRIKKQGAQFRAQTSWLWQDGVKQRLRGSKQRPRAYVSAVNDHGVAVGYIADSSDLDYQPVAWRNGAPKRLPIPAGTTGYAVGINNRGLVIGTVTPHGGSYEDVRFWYWRLDGKSGPLSTPPGYPSQLIEVDNHSRILGQMFNKKSEVVLWKGPSSQGRVLRGAVPPGEDGTTGDPPETTDMSDHGDLTGYRGGFRGSGEEPWVSRLWAHHPTRLPNPPVPGGYASSMRTTTIIRGVTWFAPQGGVSVGGHFDGYNDAETIHLGDAVIWTCTQTY